LFVIHVLVKQGGDYKTPTTTVEEKTLADLSLSPTPAMQFALSALVAAAVSCGAHALLSCNNTLYIDDYKYYLKYENITAGDIQCKYVQTSLSL
jgi:hypothetical protein